MKRNSEGVAKKTHTAGETPLLKCSLLRAGPGKGTKEETKEEQPEIETHHEMACTYNKRHKVKQ